MTAADRVLRTPQWLADRWAVPLGTIFVWKCRGKIPGVVNLPGDRSWRVDEQAILDFEAAGGAQREPRKPAAGGAP